MREGFWGVLLAMAVGLSACGTLHSLSGPLRSAPCIYSGVRLNLAVIEGNDRYAQKYRLIEPDHPVVDLPFSFALDTLFLPLSLMRASYEAVFVPEGI